MAAVESSLACVLGAQAKGASGDMDEEPMTKLSANGRQGTTPEADADEPEPEANGIGGKRQRAAAAVATATRKARVRPPACSLVAMLCGCASVMF